MNNGWRSVIAAFIALGSAAFAQSPSVAPSPVSTWAKLPPIPEPPKVSEAEKKGLELTIYYTSNIIGEIDPCG